MLKKDTKKVEDLTYKIKKLIDSKDGIAGGLHAIEHNIIKITPIFTYIDSREIGGYSYERFNKDKAVIFVYDGNEGGFGLAEILYENAEKLLNKSLEHSKNCNCIDGCPLCIYSTKCGTFNEFLDKWQALGIFASGKIIALFSQHIMEHASQLTMQLYGYLTTTLSFSIS